MRDLLKVRVDQCAEELRQLGFEAVESSRHLVNGYTADRGYRVLLAFTEDDWTRARLSLMELADGSRDHQTLLRETTIYSGMLEYSLVHDLMYMERRRQRVYTEMLPSLPAPLVDRLVKEERI